MLYLVLLLLLANRNAVQCQILQQGVDMPLDLPPQPDSNIGPGVDIGTPPGQQQSLFVDAQIDVGGGPTQFDTGGDQPQFGPGSGQTQFDMGGSHSQFEMRGDPPLTGSAGTVMGTEGGSMPFIESDGTVVETVVGGVPHIDSARNIIGTRAGGMSHVESTGALIGAGGGDMSHVESTGALVGTGAGGMSQFDSGPTSIDTAGTVIGGAVAHMPPGLDMGGQMDLGQPPVMIDQGGPSLGHKGMIEVSQGHGGFGGHVKPSECRAELDLMLLVDGSDSVYAEDFAKLKLAISEIIQDLDLGPKRIRIGWVVFSTTVSEVQPLSYDKPKLLKAAGLMLQPRDGTMTNKAIAESIREFERNGRRGVPRVVWAITDGISKLRDQTLKQASIAKEKGIEMFAIGVGLADNTELFGIASGKDKVVSLADFRSLRKYLKQLTRLICPCADIDIKRLPPGMILEPGPRSIGSVRNLMCENGLQGIGVPTIKCKKNSKWSRLNFACKACPHPMPEFGNARLKQRRDPTRPYLLGDIVEYICYDGYIIPKNIMSTCGEGPNGPIWSDLIGHCSVCDSPKNDYTDMKLDLTGKLTVGTLRHYTCHKGLVPTGPIEIACVGVNGIPHWEGPMHSCIGCDPPPKEIGLASLVEPVYEAGMVIMKGGGAYIGEERYYKCKHGYVETGTIKIVCLADQWATRWSETKNSCTACLNEPPLLSNADLMVPGGQLIGDIRIYKCHDGYMAPGSPDGTIETVCEVVKGHVGWRKTPPGCIACDEPLEIPQNAILDINSPKDTRLGTIRKYVCRDGFIQTGPITLGCVEGPGGPIWVSTDHICKTCDAPPMLENAVLDYEYGDNTIGSRRRYTCHPGYLPIGPGMITRECLEEMTGENGIAIWGPPSDICHGCDDPPAMLGNAKLVGGSNLVGDTMEYKCIDKYHSIGPVEIKCLPTGLWSDPLNTCSACHEPKKRIAHATLDSGLTLIGTRRFYKCDDGFINDGDLDITCMPDATWSKRKFKCVRCLEPPVYDNAELEPGKIDVYAVRRYTCKRGYLATGPVTTTCTPPKKKRGRPGWSKPVHYCKDCEEPFLVEHAELIPANRTIGSLQRYQCKKGFVPSAPPYSWCRPNAEWDPPGFKCIDKGKLAECMDIIGEMFKVKFHPKDYCKSPIDSYATAPNQDMGSFVADKVPPSPGPDTYATAPVQDMGSPLSKQGPSVLGPDIYATAAVQDMGNSNTDQGPSFLGPDAFTSNRDISNLITNQIQPVHEPNSYESAPIKDMNNILTDPAASVPEPNTYGTAPIQDMGNLLTDQGSAALDLVPETPQTYDQRQHASGPALLTVPSKNDNNNYEANPELNTLNIDLAKLNSGPIDMRNTNIPAVPELPIV